MSTKEQLQADNERLGREVAALRELLTAVQGHAALPEPADFMQPAYQWACESRLGDIASWAEMDEYATSAHADSILAGRAATLRERAARPLRYTPAAAGPEPVGDAEAAGILAASIITGTPLVVTDEPEYPAVGSAIPPESNGGQSGYRVGECGHRVAGSEWQAGFRRCEHCGPDLGDGEREYCPECGADEDAGEEHADKCSISDEAAASVTA